MAKDHIVQQGQTLLSIAKAEGFRDWETIWNDPGNDGLRRQRASASALAQGDTVHIPDLQRKRLAVDAGPVVQCKAVSLRGYLSQELLDEYDQPHAQRTWKVLVDDKLELTGTTDDQGHLLAAVPVDAKTAVVSVAVPMRGSAGRVREVFVAYPRLLLGALDPVDTATGVQGRLVCLGYDCPVDGDLAGDDTRRAVSEFQRRNALTVNGEVDQVTRNKVQEVHGA